MITEYLKDIYNKNNLKEYFYRNRYYILLAVIILAISIIIGYIYRDMFKQIMIELLKNMNISDTPSIAVGELFTNNLRVTLLIMLFGALFSIISTIILFINGIVIGFVSSLVPLPVMLAYVVPHGIFEIPATILAVVGAFLITKIEIDLIKGTLQKDKTFKGEIKNSSQLMKDVILTITIIVVLLVIAAIIEAFITPIIGNWIVSMLGISI